MFTGDLFYNADYTVQTYKHPHREGGLAYTSQGYVDFLEQDANFNTFIAMRCCYKGRLYDNDAIKLYGEV